MFDALCGAFFVSRLFLLRLISSFSVFQEKKNKINIFDVKLVRTKSLCQTLQISYFFFSCAPFNPPVLIIYYFLNKKLLKNNLYLLMDKFKDFFFMNLFI